MERPRARRRARTSLLSATPPPIPNPGGLSWGFNGAHMAGVLRQRPVRIAIHARQLLYRNEDARRGPGSRRRAPATSLPVALLPVQVQTRFVTRDGSPQLLVRVYPDELHLDGHEPTLTAAEVEWGRRAWRLAWPKKRGPGGRAPRLDPAVGALRPAARRVDRAQAPADEPEGASAEAAGLPGSGPQAGPGRPRARAGEAAAGPLGRHGLPGRAARPARGRRADRQAARGRADLRRRAAPGRRAPTSCRSTRECAGSSTSPRPRRSGWASGSSCLRSSWTRSSTRCSCFGIRSSLGPAAAATELEALLDAQRYTRGLGFVAPGTPTNNTTGGEHGLLERRPRRGRRASRACRRGRRGAPTARSPPGCSASTAAAALGRRGRRADGRPRRAAAPDRALAGHRRLLPRPDHGLAGGAAATFSPEQLEQARRHYLDFVRELGPLPTAPRGPPAVRPAARDLARRSSPRRPPARGRFVQSLRFLRGVWKGVLTGVPRLVGGRRANALVEILRIQPSSVGLPRAPGHGRPVLRADSPSSRAP